MEKEHGKEAALFRKFIANDCSREEIEEILASLKTSESAKTSIKRLIAQELQQAARSGQRIDPRISDDLRKRILEQIEGRLHSPALYAIPPADAALPAANRSNKLFYWRIAAALTGLLMLAAAGYRFFLYKPQVRHTTVYGEITRIVLPDSSTVVLNGNSEIRYARDWKLRPREVWLDGEAYFSVKHTDNDQKFVVHSSEGLDVEVLGTEFNVYDRADITRVVLNTGKVKLNIKKNDTETSQVDMHPGELIELHENLEYERREVDPEYYNSWINGKLVLDNTSFREIAVLLEETYGLSVDVPDTALYSERFSGTVPSENAEALLKALALSFNLDIKTKGENVIFKTK